MTTINTRIERDSMGEMEVPEDAYFGASTMRAVLNFPISDLRFPRGFIRSLALIKQAAAQTNVKLGLLDSAFGRAIVAAADEVIDGALDEHFVLDIFQTGSGTSTNTTPTRSSPTAPRSYSAATWRPTRPPQRPRQHMPVLPRRHPHGHSHRHARRHRMGACPRPARASCRAGGQGGGILGPSSDWQDAPAGRHTRPPRPGVSRLRWPGRACPATPGTRESGVVRGCPWRHRRRHRR